MSLAITWDRHSNVLCFLLLNKNSTCIIISTESNIEGNLGRGSMHVIKGEDNDCVRMYHDIGMNESGACTIGEST